jgi:hypothetical protein
VDSCEQGSLCVRQPPQPERTKTVGVDFGEQSGSASVVGGHQMRWAFGAVDSCVQTRRMFQNTPNQAMPTGPVASCPHIAPRSWTFARASA